MKWLNNAKFLIARPYILYFYLKNPPKSSSSEAIQQLWPGVAASSVAGYLAEFVENRELLGQINQKMMEKRNRPSTFSKKHEFLYLAIRLSKPEIVLETGVFDGHTSAVILQALEDNGSGLLVSVDLPAFDPILGSTQHMTETALPPGCQPGWVIPDYLRKRHRLLLGDSRELLPQLLQEYGKVDVFFHDSLHTFEHQAFEYGLAWKYLADGDLLLSDDILWSRAWDQFCTREGRPYVTLGNFGGVRK